MEPRAHLRIGSLTPPLNRCLVMVYCEIDGGSWMQDTCFFCSSQMGCISSLSGETSKRLVAELNDSNRSSINSTVFSNLLVFLRQCLDNSVMLIAFFTARVGRIIDSWFFHLFLFSCREKLEVHSKIHIER